MPKSLEHYQQETGRAGRDGLEAECVLLYSGSDFYTWKSILEKSASDPGVDPSFLPSALKHAEDMDRYCRGAVCRHRALVQYFGQAYEAQQCSACDICLGDAEQVADALTVAQKILSCVARVKERFGIGHVVSVLRGENTEAVRKWSHTELSTYGLLRDCQKADVRDWIYQLVGQGVLLQQGDPYPLLVLNPASWEVMKGERNVRLMQPVRRKKGEKVARSTADTTSWEGVDEELFEVLRGQRRQLAEERQVPPYIIFSDTTLRELARVRPSTVEKMRYVYGIGEAKLRDLGQHFLEAMDEHCRNRGLTRDQRMTPVRTATSKPASRPNPTRDLAFDLFRQGAAVEDVMHQTSRSRPTVMDYLCDFIREKRPTAISAWVSEGLSERIAAAARQVGTERLKPIFIALGEEVPYDDIRLVVTFLQARA
jgi:ATP-dependent DNA helicase RecQ